MPIYPAMNVRVPQVGQALQLREQVQRGRAQAEQATAAQALDRRRLAIQEERFTNEKAQWTVETKKRKVDLDKARADLSKTERESTTFDMRALQGITPDQTSVEAYNAAHPENVTTVTDLARDQAMADSWMAGLKPEKPQKAEIINLVSPDGTKRVGVDVRKDGAKIRNLLGEGYTKVGQQVAAQSFEGLTGTHKSGLIRDLKKKKSATDAAIDSARRLKVKAQQGASIMGMVGAATRMINSASAQAKAAGEAFGLPSLDPDQYKFEAFPEEAAQSAAFRSNMLSLAFSIASSRETGKLTDADVQRALDTFAGASGSPTQMAAALDEAITDMQRSYQSHHSVITGERYEFPEAETAEPTPPPIPVVPGQTIRSPEGVEWFGGPTEWQQAQ